MSILKRLLARLRGCEAFLAVDERKRQSEVLKAVCEAPARRNGGSAAA